jgi:hypothetical protein
MKASNKEIVKQYIYTNKVFSNVETEKEAIRISLARKGLPAITRKQKLEIFRDYKKDQSLDVLRKYYNEDINPKTNLAI